jgi:hypothetical protein
MIVVAGILWAIAGAVVGGFGSYVIMGAFGVSDFEGMRAMTAFLLFAPLGSIVGLAAGIGLALKIGPDRMIPSLLAMLVGGAVVAVIAEHWLDGPAPTPMVTERPESAFDRLPADASTGDWLALMSLDTPPQIREQAATVLAGRMDLVPALVARIAAPDPVVARDAMYFIGQLKPPPPAVAEAVKARAVDIIHMAEAIDPAAPDSRERLYAQAHVLATGVLAAAHGLQLAGIDLRPELRAMAEATREREKAAPRDIADAAERITAYFDQLESVKREPSQ